MTEHAPTPPIDDPPGVRTRLYTGGFLLVAAVAIYAGVTWYQRTAAVAAERDARQAAVQEGYPVLVATATPVGGSRIVTLPGDVRAYQQVTLYAKVSGYLRQIRVDKGDAVKSGETLAVVQSPETDQQVLSTQADLLVKRQVQSRYKALVSKGVVSQQEMDRADADLQAAEAELARLNALKDYEIIRAPFAGVITARYVDPGALLPAATGSTQSAQPVVDLADMRTVRIFVYVAQGEALGLHEGDVAHIASDGDNSIDLDAPLTRLTHAMDPRTRTMLAEIDVANQNGLFYPGLFVKVTLHVKIAPGLSIPSDAVVLKNGEAQVAVIEDNRARFRTVKVGDDDGKNVRVLAGLKPGDKVALHVGDDISEGAVVQAIESK